MENVVVAMNNVILSPYAQGLRPEAKARYINKLNAINIHHCPYVAPSALWLNGADALKALPDVCDINVSSYLQNNQSYFTEKEQNAIKSLQAHDSVLRPQSGSLQLWILPTGIVILKCLVCKFHFIKTLICLHLFNCLSR